MGDRRRWLAAIHAAKRDLGLDDDAYRALLHGACGIRSAAQITQEGQYRAIVASLRAAGWRRAEPGRLKGRLAKCYALWRRLGDAGAIRNPSYQAMMAWIGRVCGKQDVYRDDQLSLAVEALKKWQQRLSKSSCTSSRR